MAKNKNIPHQFDLNPHKDKHKSHVSSVVLVGIIFVLVVVLYFLGVFGGSENNTEDNTINREPVVTDIIDVTQGELATDTEYEDIQTTNYFIRGRVREEVITDILQYLTQNGWTIRSGTELRGGEQYMISAFETETGENIQVNILNQDGDHSVSIIRLKS